MAVSWRPWLRPRRLRWAVSAPLGARALFVGGAVLVGLVAVAFALLSEEANRLFHALFAVAPWASLVVLPAGFVTVLWLSARWFPGAQGSGIPQAIAAAQTLPGEPVGHWLSLRIAAGKVFLTTLALGCGASVGREGPSVQVGASIMHALTRYRPLARFASRQNLIVAGGAAGVAAAFNTPLAGIMFAIEELARYTVFRANSTALTAVIAAGLVSLGLLGNYAYFGVTAVTLGWPQGLPVVLVCGLAGGVAGGLFSRVMVASARGLPGALGRYRCAHPLRFAALCGLLVAVIGLACGGMSFGTGYLDTRAAIEEGADLPLLAGLGKMAATWLSFLSGVPGGVFAPSLTVGAGLGSDLATLFPEVPRSAILLLAMAAYLAAFTQAPITAFIVVAEMSRNHFLLLPLMTAAVLGHGVARLVSPHPLFFTLATLLDPRLSSHGSSERERRS